MHYEGVSKTKFLFAMATTEEDQFFFGLLIVADKQFQHTNSIQNSFKNMLKMPKKATLTEHMRKE